jgi:Ca2+/Na+ antiporter
MTTLSNQSATGSYSTKALCQIVGFACLAGFIIDTLGLVFPAAFGSMEWRMGFVQQISDRSVILLFGLALMMYGIIDNRTLRKRLAMFCMVLGMVFCLTSILVVRDSWALRNQAEESISSQAAKVQTQIDKTKDNPPANAKNITPQQLEQASRVLGDRAETLKQNARTSVLKAGFATIGNLIVIGLAMLGLGRYGARPTRH